MSRCIELAEKGRGLVAPNPMVGAILVHEGRIVGEGYHEVFGQAHAEVNAIRQVKDSFVLTSCTLYVTLEPCAHYGKTPPCANLIVEKKIPRVVIGSCDPFPKVDGRGIRILEDHGVEVITGVLEKECQELNKRFNTFYSQHRPYIILKWAETADGFIGAENQETGKALKISHPSTDVLVHQWRTEEQGILVGKNTVLKDDPLLNVRHVKGRQPIPFIMALQEDIPAHYKINTSAPVFIGGTNPMQNLVDYCIKHQVQSVLVEGGAATLRYFIDNDYWDEARVITNTTLRTGSGIPAPVIKKPANHEQMLGADKISYYISAAQ